MTSAVLKTFNSSYKHLTSAGKNNPNFTLANSEMIWSKAVQTKAAFLYEAYAEIYSIRSFPCRSVALWLQPEDQLALLEDRIKCFNGNLDDL